MVRRLIPRLNENELILAYALVAVLNGAALILVHTAWSPMHSYEFPFDLEFGKSMAHSARTAYLLSLVTLGFFRVRTLWKRQSLRYPYVASMVGNLAVMAMMVWTGLRGLGSRSFVTQIHNLVAVVFVASLMMAMFDALAFLSPHKATGKAPRWVVIFAQTFHILSVIAVIITAFILEAENLEG